MRCNILQIKVRVCCSLNCYLSTCKVGVRLRVSLSKAGRQTALAVSSRAQEVSEQTLGSRQNPCLAL